jgi:hypothetical protein
MRSAVVPSVVLFAVVVAGCQAAPGGSPELGGEPDLARVADDLGEAGEAGRPDLARPPRPDLGARDDLSVPPGADLAPQPDLAPPSPPDLLVPPSTDLATPTAIAPYPGITPVQIDGSPAYGLRTADDEAHVMVQRTSEAGRYSVALDVITIPSSGPAVSRPLSTAVRTVNGFPQADFSLDSKGLYFIDDSAQPSRLVVANADGTSTRAIATGVQRAWLGGNTLVYLVDGPTPSSGYREVWAVTLPSGTPVRLVASGALYYPWASVNATGTAAVVWEDSGTPKGHRLIQTATGAVTMLPQKVTTTTWTASGSHLVYSVGGTGWPQAVRAIKSDGSNDVELAPTTSGQWFTVSPASDRVAISTPGANGWLGKVTFASLTGGASIVMDAPAGRTWSSVVYWSRDGGLAIVSGASGAIAAAPVRAGASFVELTTGVDNQFLSPPTVPWVVSPANDRVAVNKTGRVAAVVGAAGGATNTLSVPVDHQPMFEGVRDNPGLLVFTHPTKTQSYVPGTLALFPADGRGPARLLPGAARSAYTQNQAAHEIWPWQQDLFAPFTWGWFGSAILYEADYTADGFDLVAATDDLATLGAIARGVAVWSVRTGAVPSKIVFTRRTQPGVWVTRLPQTPGR